MERQVKDLVRLCTWKNMWIDFTELEIGEAFWGILVYFISVAFWFGLYFFTRMLFRVAGELATALG